MPNPADFDPEDAKEPQYVEDTENAMNGDDGEMGPLARFANPFLGQGDLSMVRGMSIPEVVPGVELIMMFGDATITPLGPDPDYYRFSGPDMSGAAD